ncbi:DMSO/TMAO reductase YedYZ molybdopterin-dependent catalytic subunit [Murinocardiopsis flavida]|uniref:DMSO/TMAO reductase YedYZ molybdopterin-dependent catalytic subunit n=1 Tax=Murinocardiopsis flavida TaxID=645275 RepID=A0A2P8CPL9_9ACTN|nr:molybdopterin-dependent oxidoreductase [Murinocardiopsis flavida]PSK86915.1 DMSO/TMAO reductase YedYZ molybdopterin-dependent catalytic subunit [Murinocardiopsis flavida]
MPGVSTETRIRRATRRLLLGAAVGLPVTALALGVAEAVAGLLDSPQASPVIVVGDAAVDYSPAPLKEFAIAAFGLYDKAVLVGGIVAVLALSAVLLGSVALRRPALGHIGLAVFAAAGVLAVFLRRDFAPLAVLPVLIGAAAGAGALALLAARAAPALAAAEARKDSAVPRAPGPGPEDGSDSAASGTAPPSGPARRPLLLMGAGVLAAAAAGGGIGRWSLAGSSDGRAGVRLPAAAKPLPPLPKGSDLKLPGLTPFSTPAKDFYRIDTALSVPRVRPDEWLLRVHGLVDRPVELDFEELLKRPMVEADITLTCVSNQVGGELAGNTRWLGVRLDTLLSEAGVQRGANQILSTSADGWTCGTPTEITMDGRDAILAVAMGGEPLTGVHGFPVRMVVPGLYGFVSATKWVTDIKLTRFADERAYWAQRDWAVEAPIKTMARIDVPGPLERVEPGARTVAGVAWAQHRGIDAVEVRVDDGEWREAALAEVPGIDTWRQWTWDWRAEPGRHTLRVRATDASGRTQTAGRAEPIPNGASGHHSVQVLVE